MTTKHDNRPKETLGRALDIYREAMRSFIMYHLRRIRGVKQIDAINRALSVNAAAQFQRNLQQNNVNVEQAIDIGDFRPIIQNRDNWREAFSGVFANDMAVVNEMGVIASARNDWAHSAESVSDPEYARARLTDIATILGRINKPQQKAEVEKLRAELTPPQLAMQKPHANEPEVAAPAITRKLTPRTNGKLVPWREVIKPHDDVIDGSFAQAEFAADLHQVYTGKASAIEYGDPLEFFKRSYITPGIKTLLVNAAQRINGKGGEPVIQTKTGFGGGKTHSLIALYHLATSTQKLVAGNKDVQAIFREAQVEPAEGRDAKVSVLSGVILSPTDPDKTEKGDPLNTLWGVMAYQLGGQESYNIVGEAARTGTAPGGNQLDRLFAHVSPCIILIDELVAYVRNLRDEMRSSVYTFLQSLTESARRNECVSLVVTLPESKDEAGGTDGMEALRELEKLFGRTEAIWQPLEINEAFEVVRRRLFKDEIDFRERDRTCEAFTRMYGNSPREYPPEAREVQYLERMKNCYPIHPEIFDRLYSDWSTRHHFQRTRGVLRLMASVISNLNRGRDSSPLIMPASLGMDDTSISGELAKVLDGNWDPVITEIDGNASRTKRIDQSQKRYGNVGGAARRIGRTIFLGSARTGAVKGIDQRQIMLGAVEPTQGMATYRDALNHMLSDLYFLYQNNDKRCFFHTEENLNKVVADRTNAVSDEQIEEHIVKTLGEASKRGRRNHPQVVVCPTDSSEAPEDEATRIVVLRPENSIPSRKSESSDAQAENVARHILLNRGDADRINTNTLLFLAAKRDDVRGLSVATRNYLAWYSILNGETKLELGGSRLADAQRNLRSAEEKVKNQIPNAYRWILAPAQNDPHKSVISFRQISTNASDTADIIGSAVSTCLNEEVLVDKLAPSILADTLNTHVWSNANYKEDHIAIDVLWQMFTNYLYMPRLQSRAVLETTINGGPADKSFGVADSASKGSYQNLKFGGHTINSENTGGMMMDNIGPLIVNPDMAQLLIEQVGPPLHPDPNDDPDDVGGDNAYRNQPPKPIRASASISSNGDLSLDDFSALRDEITRPLSNSGAEVTVTITIEASHANGFEQKTERIIRENGKQLGLNVQFN